MICFEEREGGREGGREGECSNNNVLNKKRFDQISPPDGVNININIFLRQN